MRLDEAGAYQDALDAVVAGTATPAQLDEAQAVIMAVRQYLDPIDTRAQIMRGMLANSYVFSDERRIGLLSVIGGAGQTPRISIVNGVVKTAVEIEAEAKAAEEAAAALERESAEPAPPVIDADPA